MSKENLLRISALIHNFEDKTSFQSVLRKVIDFVFVSSGKKELKITEIVHKLKSEKGLLMDFSEEEISNVCNQFEKTYIVEGKKDFQTIKMDEIYYSQLLKQYEDKDIDTLIKEFYEKVVNIDKLNKYSLKNTTEAIHIFLYETLIDSRNDFNKLFLNKENILTKKIRTKDVKIINMFLEWDNTLKDEILESIYFSGYEFAILTVKKNLINKQSFANKILYLDTNVIFRLLGINGPELQQRAEVYIKRFRKVGIEIRISHITKLEYVKTIENKYNFIQGQMSNTRPANLGKLSQYTFENYTFMNFYIDWSTKGSNKTIKGFKTYLDGLFIKMADKYGFIIENSVAFNKEDKEHIESLKYDYQDFLKYQKSDFTLESDVRNYKYILKLRGEEIDSFNNIRQYLLTNDYQLINYDNSQDNNTKVTIHPSRLLSLVLRYSGRVVDTEIKSFMKLIKIDINSGDKLPEETIYIINDQLNKYETNIELQDQYLNALFEIDLVNEFKDLDYNATRQRANDIFEDVSKKIALQKEKENITLAKELQVEKNKTQKTKAEKKRLIIIVGILVMIIVLLIMFYLYDKKIFDGKTFLISAIITIAFTGISQFINLLLNKKEE